MTEIDFSKVTRVQVVSGPEHSHEHWADSWIISLQDDGRTLKLFARGKGHMARQARDVSLAKDIGELLDRKPHAL